MSTTANASMSYTEDDLNALQDLIIQNLQQGGTLADLKGITDDQCEALYTLGYGLYERGRYTDALKILGYLVMLNHTEHRYLLALGATAQALGKYEDALKQYMAATLLDPTDPSPVVHSIPCLIELGHFQPALESCDLAIAMCTQDSHAALLQRAKSLRAAIVARRSKES